MQTPKREGEEKPTYLVHLNFHEGLFPEVLCAFLLTKYLNLSHSIPNKYHEQKRLQRTTVHRSETDDDVMAPD